MKKVTKFIASALAISTLSGTALTVFASEPEIQPYGYTDEQWQYETVVNGYGKSQKIESYSNVNVGTTSLTLLSSYCQPFTTGYCDTTRGTVQTGKRVRFRGFWSHKGDFSDAMDTAIYDMTHQY